MTKRIVSLTLSLIMVLSLFTGLSFPAGAEEETPTVTYTYEKADAVQENDEVVLVCEGDGFINELNLDGEGEANEQLGAVPFQIVNVGDGAYAFKYTDEFGNDKYLKKTANDHVAVAADLDDNAKWGISIIDGDAQITQYSGSNSISYDNGLFVCYDQAGLPVQLYKRTAVSSVEEPDSAEDIHIYFVDQTQSENTSIYFAQSETPENLTVINTEAVGETSADSGDEEGFLAGKAYTDEDGLVNYYTLDQKMEGDETWVFFAAGGKNTVGLPFKTDAIEATGGAHDKEKYVVYNITEVNGELTATIANDVWPEDTAVVTAPTCTEAGKTTYTGEYTGTTKDAAGDPALGHSWGEWGVVDGHLKRTCSRCGETEEKNLEDGFYLIGVNGWDAGSLTAADKFKVNPSNSAEYMLRYTLEAGTELKVVKISGNQIAKWYPEGVGNNYVVNNSNAGNVDIYFRESYYDDWGGHLYIASSNPMGAITIRKTLILDSTISVQYAVLKSSLTSLGFGDDVQIVAEVHRHNNNQETLETYRLDPINTDYYGFLLYELPNIYAYQMNDETTIYLEGVKDGKTWRTAAEDYNPMTYCYNKAMATPAKASDNYLRTVCTDMIAYAAAAQTNFGYNTGNLPTDDARWASIEQYGTSTDRELTQERQFITNAGQIAAFTRNMISLEGRIVITYALLPDTGADLTGAKCVFSYADYKGDQKTVEVSFNEWTTYSPYYLIELRTLNAGELNSYISATVMDASGQTVLSNTVKYSVESYAKSRISNTEATEKEKVLLHKLMNYGYSANEYFVFLANNPGQ